MGGRGAHDHPHRVDDEVVVDAGALGDGGGHVIDGVVEAQQVEVDLEPVARRHHHGATDVRTGLDQVSREARIGQSEPVELLEGDVMVAASDESQHHEGGWYAAPGRPPCVRPGLG